MFERIFACLLRLYPSRFRRVYDGEARQLLRERFRDEAGLLRRLRLCLDLIIDTAVGLPQAYWTTPKTSVTASVRQPADGIPGFHLLGEEKTHLGSFLIGSAVTLTALGLFSFVLIHEPPFRSHFGLKGRVSPIEAVIQRLNQPIPTSLNPQQHHVFAHARSQGTNAPQAKVSPLRIPLKPTSRPERMEAVIRRLNQPLPANPNVQQRQVTVAGRMHGTAPPQARIPSLAILAKPPSRMGNNPETAAKRNAASVIANGSSGFNFPSHAIRNPIVGTWQGTLHDSQRELRMFVTIREPRAGALTILFECSGEEQKPVTATSVSFRNGRLKFAIRPIGGSYVGRLVGNGKSIAGTWRQGLNSGPLLLNRVTFHPPIQRAH